MDKGGNQEWEEYLEGWPTIGKALKDLALRAIIHLKWLDEKLLEVVIWALEQILLDFGGAQEDIAQLAVQGT